jgi:hypothetical protein
LVDGTNAGFPTCQAETLEVKLPGSEVLNPGKTVRTTEPAVRLKDVGIAAAPEVTAARPTESTLLRVIAVGTDPVGSPGDLPGPVARGSMSVLARSTNTRRTTGTARDPAPGR